MAPERTDVEELNTYIPMNMNEVEPAFAPLTAGVYVMRVASAKVQLSKKASNPMAVFTVVPVYKQGAEPGARLSGSHREFFVLSIRPTPDTPLEEAKPNPIGMSSLRTFCDNCGVNEYPNENGFELKSVEGCLIGMRIADEPQEDGNVYTRCTANFAPSKVEGYTPQAE